MYLWWSLCTLYLQACQESYRRRLRSFFAVLMLRISIANKHSFKTAHGKDRELAVSYRSHFTVNLFQAKENHIADATPPKSRLAKRVSQTETESLIWRASQTESFIRFNFVSLEHTVRAGRLVTSYGMMGNASSMTSYDIN